MEIDFSSESAEPPLEWEQISSMQSLLISSLGTIKAFENYANDYFCTTILVSDNTILKINKDFRMTTKVTDVITFPFPKETLPGEILSAEIYICEQQARTQAISHKHSLFEEFSLLLAHGLIHSIGIDHENSREEKMKTLKLEKKILGLWGIHAPSLTTYGK